VEEPAPIIIPKEIFDEDDEGPIDD
jgi:hypothetical protein